MSLSERPEPRDLHPKWMYQCVSKPGFCKFEWCCGPLCACVIGAPKGGLNEKREKRDIKVARARQARWRYRTKKKREA